MKAFRVLFTVIILAMLLVACSAPQPVSRAGENTKVYFSQGGDELVVASGGTLTLASGSTFANATTFTSTGAAALNGGLTVDTTAFTVADTSGNVSTAGTLQVYGTSELRGDIFDGGGSVSVLDDFTVSGDVTVAGEAIYTMLDWTPTDNETLTVAATAYRVNSAGNVTITLGTTADAGQLVLLYGDDANTITIADTNLLSADGNAVTFGQYDTVLLVFNGTAWALIAKSANQ